MTATAPAASPGHLNQLMIEAIADAAQPVGASAPRVLDAIRAVPRHVFVPGAGLADAYNPDLAASAATSAPGVPTARPRRASRSTRAPHPAPRALRSSRGSTAR